VECRKGAYEGRGGAGDVGGEGDVGEGGVVQQWAVKEQVGGGARWFATDTFRRGLSGAVVEVGRGVSVSDTESGDQGKDPAGSLAVGEPWL